MLLYLERFTTVLVYTYNCKKFTVSLMQRASPTLQSNATKNECASARINSRIHYRHRTIVAAMLGRFAPCECSALCRGPICSMMHMHPYIYIRGALNKVQVD